MRKNTQAQQNTMAATGDEMPTATLLDVSPTLESVTASEPGKGTRAMGAIDKAAINVSTAIADKVAIRSAAKQRLAYACDLYGEGKGKSREADEIAGTAVIPLIAERADGHMTAKELSALLGDVWGFKPKADGKPGSTPQGEGEAIRKRIVRAVAAAEYVNGTKTDGYFEGLDATEIAPILSAVYSGTLSVWTAYEAFADVKKAHAVKTETAFNPEAIAKIVATLSNEGSAEIVLASQPLLAVYAALRDMIEAINAQSIED